MPKISVIIPVYGVEKYIERCVRSLFEQTLDSIEYIFVDDCSPDNSIKVLEQIIDEYRTRFEGGGKSVRIVKMPTNSGLPAVRRHGIQLATGDFIIHCDSDDWVDVTMYQKLYEKAIADDSDIVVCGYRETDGTIIIKQSTHRFKSKAEYLSNMLYMKESWVIWDKLCKRELYQGLDYPKYSMGEDLVMTFQLVLKANKISNSEEQLYNYFFNPESITKVRTEDCRYNNWKQSAFNSTKTISYLIDSKEGAELKDEIDFLKFKQKRLAGDLAYNKKYAREWLDTFSSINSSAYRLKHLSWIEKIKFYIIVVCAYIKA